MTSSSVFVTPQKFALSTSWTKYTKTFTIPNITGKTIGTDNNDFLQIAFLAGADLLITLERIRLAIKMEHLSLLNYK